MAPTTEQIAAAASVGKTVAEAALPILIPFDPVISLIMTAIISHFQATGTWPSEAQVLAALPADFNRLVTDWSAWRPSGDGTLKA